MKRQIITILVLAAVCGGASAQQPVDKNNQELVRLHLIIF